MRIDIADLIADCRVYRAGGTNPAIGIDCWWMVRTIAARIYPNMSPIELPSSDEEIAAAIERVSPGPHWEEVVIGHDGASMYTLRVGDILYGKRPMSLSAESPTVPFVAIVVDDVTFQCATAEQGVAACVRLASKLMPNVTSVFRRVA